MRRRQEDERDSPGERTRKLSPHDVSIVSAEAQAEGDGVIAGRDTKFTVTWPVAYRGRANQHRRRAFARRLFGAELARFRCRVTDRQMGRQAGRQVGREIGPSCSGKLLADRNTRPEYVGVSVLRIYRATSDLLD